VSLSLRDTRALPDGEVTQLVILLHGVGVDGRDLISLADVFRSSLPNTAFVSPDAPEAYDMAPMGRQWFSLREWTIAHIEEGLKKARPALDAYIDQLLAEYNLTPKSCALLGFSQGTMMALYTALRRTSPLACVLGYSGALFGSDELERDIRSRHPIMLIHGSTDEVVPAAASRMAAAALSQAKVDVTLHLIDGLGHGIENEGLALGAAFLQRHLKAK
jgi:phospholipase/carboxylesterase